MPRRFPPPWTVEQIPGGYKVKDANGQALADVYARETQADAAIEANLGGASASVGAPFWFGCVSRMRRAGLQLTSRSCRRCLIPNRIDSQNFERVIDVTDDNA